MSQQRRRFVGKVRKFTERSRQEFAQAGFPLVPEDQMMVLEDYLDISRRRHGATIPLFKLQLHMLQDLVVAEKGVAQYKRRLKELKVAEDESEEIAAEDANEETPRQGDAEKSEGQETSDEVKAIRRELYFLRSEIRSLRDIADGIAWRLFDCDRAALHELARRSTRPHINPEGILAELHTFASYSNERSGIAVLNDLTNFLKFGDVTVRRHSGEFEIVEVKSGTSGSGRLTRQRQGIMEVVELLSRDQGREVTGEPVRISEVQVTPEMFVGNLAGVLARAGREGAGVEIVGSHLVMDCMDFRAGAERHLEKEKVFGILERGWRVVDRWKESGDFVLVLDASERYAHAQNYAPASVLPLEPSMCVRIMAGSVALTAVLNVSAVLRGLEGRGWVVVKPPERLAAEAAEEGKSEAPIAVLRRGRLTTSLPAALVGRLGMEFLKPKSLSEMLDAVLESDGERGYSFVNLAGEREMWR